MNVAASSPRSDAGGEGESAVRGQVPSDPTDQPHGSPASLSALAGWGNHPVVQAFERRSEDLERITEGVVLTRGLGRSYGDASLPPSGTTVASATMADRLLAFDPDTGIVRAEAGVPLRSLNRLFFPRLWFTPVTPGTHYVTLGGMVAADVHGKNHHVAGCFGEHVKKLRMRVAGGRILECSGDIEADLFHATLGGMGLTGHILEVGFQMERIASPWIWQESERVADFDELLVRLEGAGRDWPFTVCWADFLSRGTRRGRGILMKGRWAELDEAPPRPPRWRAAPSVPFLLPSGLLQTWMVRAFNEFIFAKHGARTSREIVHPETYFYPLDVIQWWNRVYGRRGFTQYQCVLPGPSSHPRHRRFLQVLEDQRAPIFFCVIKDCGPEGKGMISFPKPGISYALDLPVTDATQRIVDAANELVASEGGRIYLAKDAFTRAEHFAAMEPRLPAWEAVRRKWDPEGQLRSAQSIRVLGDRP